MEFRGNMTVISKEETSLWLLKHNINEENILSNYDLKLSKQLPVDFGAKNYLAKEIASVYNGNEVLLYICEFGIWPSCENLYLFDGYRKSIGIKDNIHKKPSHLICKDENIEFYCILDMILYFYMGCIIVPLENQDEIMKISHDEYLEIYTKKEKNKNEITNRIKEIMNKKE